MAVAMNVTLCAEDGCFERSSTRGFCNKHYKYKLRYGEIPKRTGPQKCQVTNCNDLKEARGLCHRHYALWRRNGTVMPDDPEKPMLKRWLHA